MYYSYNLVLNSQNTLCQCDYLQLAKSYCRSFSINCMPNNCVLQSFRLYLWPFCVESFRQSLHLEPETGLTVLPPCYGTDLCFRSPVVPERLSVTRSHVELLDAASKPRINPIE